MHIKNNKGDLLYEIPFSSVIFLLIGMVLLMFLVTTPRNKASVSVKLVSECALVSFLEETQHTLTQIGELEEGEFEETITSGPVTTKISYLVKKVIVDGLETYRIEYVLAAKTKNIKTCYNEGSTIMCSGKESDDNAD